MARVEGNGEASGRGLAEKLETLTATTITITIVTSIFCLSSYYFYYHYCCYYYCYFHFEDSPENCRHGMVGLKPSMKCLFVIHSSHSIENWWGGGPTRQFNEPTSSKAFYR